MPDFLTAPFASDLALSPGDVFVRLVLALLLGMVVAGVYRTTRPSGAVAPSFTVTLTLLCILIAMVTQVIGDNVARAFSLVGALSIVRFRTVVRDTQDTAYVIFAVAVGMAVGAANLWVAVAGIPVVAAAALLMRPADPAGAGGGRAFRLKVRLATGGKADAVLGTTLDAHTTARLLVSATTARQGMALDLVYDVTLGAATAPDACVKALNRLDGVQDVALERAATGREDIG
jgi:hypothetical protein